MGHALQPGDVLGGRYRLERVLGEGGVSRVWLARDTRERGMVWAVKQLLVDGLDPAERAEVTAAFRREGEMLRRCSHRGFPRFGALLSELGFELLCMERIEGPTLEEVLHARSTPLPEWEVARWAVQLCDLLAVLHEQHPALVYRDLKPANCMLTTQQQLALVDFGIVCEAYYHQTVPEPCYGTPGYAAPEQYRGFQQPRSDLYALGATIHHLLTGRDPQAGGFAPLRQLRPDCHPSLEGLLRDCLQVDPQARPQDVREVAQRLVPLCQEVAPGWQERLRRWWVGSP